MEGEFPGPDRRFQRVGEVARWRPDPFPGARRREGAKGVEGTGYDHPESRDTGWVPLPSDDHRNERRIFFKDDKAPAGYLVEIFVDIVFQDQHADGMPWRWTTQAVINEDGDHVARVLGGWRVGSRTAARNFGSRTSNSFLQRIASSERQQRPQA